LRVITWNVNSIRTRLERLLDVMDRHRPDLLCLQETKVEDASFPHAEIAAAGYRAETHGQKTYNGVALIARAGLALDEVARGFVGDPAPEQARAIAARCGGIRFVNLYVVNGQAVGSEKYALKLRWLDALRAALFAAHQPSQQLVLLGDFNIAPEDRDVHDPEIWRGQVLCSDEERTRLRALLEWGTADLFRRYETGPGHYSWWDYRAGAFARDNGLRIDLALGTAPAAARCTGARHDREARKQGAWESKPSDHAPLILEFAD
jgi:exodeoxyribonuclease-3